MNDFQILMSYSLYNFNLYLQTSRAHLTNIHLSSANKHLLVQIQHRRQQNNVYKSAQS